MNLTERIDNDKKIIEGLYAMFNYKTTNDEDLSNVERYNIKGEKNWEAFVANKLINKMYDSNGERIIYNNILFLILFTKSMKIFFFPQQGRKK